MAEATFYSAAADGRVRSHHISNYGSARYGTGTLEVFTGQETIALGQQPGYYLHLPFLRFNTAALPDDAVITAVDLSIVVATVLSTPSWTINVAAVPFGASLSTSDWRTPDQLQMLTVITSATRPSGAGRLTFPDSASLRSAISRTGNTDLLLWSSRQQIGFDPSEDEAISFYASEQTGTTNDPRLIVTYSEAGGGAPPKAMHYQRRRAA
jgi:hypothetical protein